MNQDKEQNYITTSFYLTCFLICRGLKLTGIHRLDQYGRAGFIFVDSPLREKAIEEFSFDEQAEVNVRDFIAALRQVKSLLHEPKETSHDY